MLYHTNLNDSQRTLLKVIFPPMTRKLRVHDPYDILEAIFFIVYTGCQWSRLPVGYPPYQTVYHHYRSWSAKGYLETALNMLVMMRRRELGQPLFPTVAVIDSQSVRTGLPHAVSGVDGGKRVKGIKRHIAVDRNGYPLGLYVTTANVHDSKGAVPLISNTLSTHREIRFIKADMGYRGALREMPLGELGVVLDCVKSNYGTSGFVPIDGRWIVERTFSWMQNYRRMMRNYERYLHTAGNMAMFALVFFMLRYFG